MELTPKQVVRELDRYIIGQDEAKRAVAVALRNRYRRAQLPEEIRDEIVPKNILMVGPTGVGKTEIARRLARLVDAPFVKVEATKFTEVGYVGRDVESIIRDLVEASVRICKEKASQKVKARATVLAEERIIDLILHPNRKPVNPIDVLLGNKPKQPELPAEEKQRIAQKADELRAQLMRGELEDVEIEVEVEDAPKDVEINGASVNIGSMMGDMMPKKTKMRRMKVADARRLLVAEEEDKLIDMDAVTEEALRRAEQDGIIFIDEIDAVGRKRGSGMGGGHDEREQTLNQLLVEMDGFDNDTNLIIIAATNRPDVLDPALLRPGRFDRQVGVAAPDLEGREAILRVHAKGKPFVPDVDLHMVAVRTPGFTGADLANVLNEAALLCARAGAQLIDNRAIDEAIDRVQAGPKRKSKGMALEELRNTAYHEGGHALVAAALNNTDPVTKVTILPRGRALGYTAVMPTSDRYSQSRNQLLDQMAYAMGGRTAEEIVFHDPTTGASNDIEKATNIARTMVIEYGFSDKLGAIKWGSDDDQTTVMDGLQPRKYSDRTAEVIDDEVLKLVETAHTEAWTIINDNREILDELVRQLLVKETLNEKELAEIFAPIKKAPVRPVWLSNDRRPDSDKPPVEIPESLKRSVGMKPEE